MITAAHMTVVTPGRCGLYETTRELVVALRQQGVDSRLVDPTRETNKLYPGGDEDRGAPLAGMDWAVKADVIVNHSGYDNTPVGETDQPVVHVAHGRPRSSFLSEMNGGTPIYSYHYQKNKDPRFKSVVTFWPQHRGYLAVMFPDKPVHMVQACVDLDRWTPNGPTGYNFHGHKAKVNVVCTDAFRDDIDPFVPINVFALWARRCPGAAKLHVYAKPENRKKGWDALLRRVKDDGNLGEVQPWVKGLDNVYRAATFMITAHEIDTRSVREAMACGCPVARVPTFDEHSIDGYEDQIYWAMTADRKGVRMEAERRFGMQRTGEQFKGILEEALQ